MTPHAESEVLSAYLDGELESAAAASVETHLGECPDCAARLEGLQETVASLRRLERPPLPEAVTRGLRQRLQRERERPRRTAWLDAFQIGEHTSELQSPCNLVCRLLLEKKKSGT